MVHGISIHLGFSFQSQVQPFFFPPFSCQSSRPGILPAILPSQFSGSIPSGTQAQVSSSTGLPKIVSSFPSPKLRWSERVGVL